MNIPSILAGEVHLPLKESTISAEAIDLANNFYQTNLDTKDFKESQAFWGANGRLMLELIDKEDTVQVTFVNKALLQNKAPISITESNNGSDEEDWGLINPIFSPGEYESWIGAPVSLQSEEEIAFLDALGTSGVYPTEGNDNTLAYKLAALLNSYQFLGRWVSGTIGENCTGGFELVFKGHSLDVPDGFLVDYSPMIAIIRIHKGTTTGYLCLRT